MMCLSVMWEHPAVCLQHQFVAKDAEDTGCDTTAMPRPLINWYFWTAAIAHEPTLVSLLDTHM